MCVFCASVPAVLALGTAAHAKQRQAGREAVARGEAPKKPRLPALKLTGVVVAGILVGSVVYHATTRSLI